MNKFESERRLAERMKRCYPPGTRLVLLSMDDPYAPVPSGTKGTVVHVDDAAQIHMKWDNGRTLAIVPGEDSFRTMSHGKCLTARISESPNPERECILSDILETDVPEKYYLSQKQMERLLFRLSPEHRESVCTQTAESESP